MNKSFTNFNMKQTKVKRSKLFKRSFSLRKRYKFLRNILAEKSNEFEGIRIKGNGIGKQNKTRKKSQYCYLNRKGNEKELLLVHKSKKKFNKKGNN